MATAAALSWILAGIVLSAADQPSAATVPIVSRVEFKIDKEGRLIILPVHLEGEVIQCLLDTGASSCGFDSSLKRRLGERSDDRVIRTPAGQRIVETFDWPKAMLGGHSLKTDRSVLCLDLESVRQATGKDVRGFLGMDVLGTCRIQIDFDHGNIRFLDSLPEDRSTLGLRIPISFRDVGTPWIAASLKDDKREDFLIDTGTQGNSLTESLFREYADQGLIALGTPSTSVTLAGTVNVEAGRICSFSVGPFRQDDMRVACADVNSVGVRYLSRFQVFLDFPGSAVYLRKGANHHKPEPQATSGMSLAWVDGRVVVKDVLSGGPADLANLKPEDVLLRVDDKDAAEFDHFSLRKLLTSQVGRVVPLTIRRRDREIRVEVVLIEK